MPSEPNDPECPGYAPGPGDPLDPEYLERRVRERPDDWRRWHQLGDRLLDLGRPEEAAPALRRAVRLNPGGGLSWRKLAQALARTDVPAEEVLEVAEHAAELRPRDAKAWGTLAATSLAMGRTGRALEAFQRKVRLAPHYETWWLIGLCLDRLRRHREALIALEETVRLKPNHLPALRLLYLTGRRLGEDDTARTNLAALFRHNPVRARELMEGYVEKNRSTAASPSTRSLE